MIFAAAAEKLGRIWKANATRVLGAEIEAQAERWRGGK
jgi:hypothetical protein